MTALRRRSSVLLSAPLLAGALSLLVACDIPPKHIDQQGVEQAIAKGRFKSACKGLEMKDEETRTYTAQMLAKMVKDPIAKECVCANIADEENGYDMAIIQGLDDTKRDDLVSCFADLVKKPDLKNRTDAIKKLARFKTESAKTTLAGLASEAGVDPEARVAAMNTMSGVDHKDLFLKILSSDPDAPARAGAASRLNGVKGEDVVAALLKAAKEDTDGAVRASAMVSLKMAGVEEVTALLCEAMMTDPSADARRIAISAFRGTRSEKGAECLRARAMAEETEASVREEMLTVLKSSPHPVAAATLCEAIPFWIKTYAVTDLPEKLPGTQIIEAQNARDHEKSYECVNRAYGNQAGYSCFGKMYVGWWLNELGGKGRVPECPGYPAPK